MCAKSTRLGDCSSRQRPSHASPPPQNDTFQTALAAAGVEGKVRSFHDLRHTALTNLAATGASPVAIMATAGHRSMQTKKGYLHLAGVVFHEEASALERRLLGVKIRVESRPNPHR